MTRTLENLLTLLSLINGGDIFVELLLKQTILYSMKESISLLLQVGAMISDLEMTSIYENKP